MGRDAKVIELLVEGRSCPEIAALLKVDKQVIQRRVRKLKLPNNIYIKYRPSKTPLNQVELDVLIGGLLGDTWIGYTKKAKNPSGSFTHKMEHIDYVVHKYNLLKRLCSKPTIHNKFDKRSERCYQQAFCKIATNPLLTEVVGNFYSNGKKVVCEHFLKKLSPLAVAIWFMDDGSKTRYGYKISTDCFIREDVTKLVYWLNSFDIKATINSENSILINFNSKVRFTELIREYIIPCMTYKLHIQ